MSFEHKLTWVMLGVGILLLASFLLLAEIIIEESGAFIIGGF